MYIYDKDKSLTDVRYAIDSLTNLVKSISAQDLKYRFDKYEGYAKALFERFAPFKPGDRVVLVETPVINEKESWGWLGHKHYLVAGAVATVKAVDYKDDQFIAEVVFDNESWLRTHGLDKNNNWVTFNPPVLVPVEESKKGTFAFGEKWLKKI